MAVDTTHADYTDRLPQWVKMRHVTEGEDAIKAAGTAYLPRLGGQEDDQYHAYKLRAGFYGATGRTVDGLSGMVFRKAPVFDGPAIMDDFKGDVTLSGVPLLGFAEQAVEEVLTAGRCGVMVDYPRVEQGGMTRREAERMNLRPFWTLYRAEAILNWRVGLVANKTTLLQVRLLESVPEQGDDEFEEVEVEQVRVLDLTGDGADLVYRQRIYRKASSGAWEQSGEDIYPQVNGQPMREIPFIFLGPRDTTPAVPKPPLLDLAQINLSHYRTNADLEHGAHFAALPTPWASGVSEGQEPEAIGPEALWVFTGENVEVGMLEFTGTGLAALEKRREVKEQQMAALGARMLAPEKRQAEAAETAAIHRQGEISVLASIALAVSQGLTQASEIARDWYGSGEDVSVKLNTDFMPTPMPAPTLTALFKMVQGGRISQRVFFDNLQRGEIISPERDFEDEEIARSEDYLDHLTSIHGEDDGLGIEGPEVPGEDGR